MIPSVFLSHNWQDKDFARKLASDLLSYGIYVWIDEAEIQVGDSLVEKIRQGIDIVDYLIVVLSPDSVNSEWVKKEVDIAMNQEIDNRRVKVFPVSYRPCDLPWFLQGKLYADFTNPEDYGVALRKLLGKIGVKDNIFKKQNSSFQKIESLLYPLIREANKALSSKNVYNIELQWDHHNYRLLPNNDLVNILDKLRKEYSMKKSLVLELLALNPDQLSAFAEIEQIYAEIISTRLDKLRPISLLETEAAPMIRNRAYDSMKAFSRRLTEFHQKYLELTRKIIMESMGEKLWCIETKLELDSILDDLYLTAYCMSDFDKPIG